MLRKKECVAMLLAGGQGSRLYALTSNIAKPAVVRRKVQNYRLPVVKLHQFGNRYGRSSDAISAFGAERVYR